MITGISSRMFRPQTVTAGMRQQVVSRTSPVMSKQVAGKVTLMLCVGIFVVFAFSQFMRWQITASISELEQLQAARNLSGRENISLLDKRTQLVSREFIIDKAGARYQLLVPQKDQMQRL